MRALETASRLFYNEGARAVGMEAIVARSGIAKTTIYRHFPTKDALIEAFLEAEDEEFWRQWDEAVSRAPSPGGALVALCRWIGGKLSQEGYRGCPQINLAAEFADPAHPARIVSRRHKAEMHRRLTLLCEDVGVQDAPVTAMQISLLFDGAFTSGAKLEAYSREDLLVDAVKRLLA